MKNLIPGAMAVLVAALAGAMCARQGGESSPAGTVASPADALAPVKGAAAPLTNVNVAVRLRRARTVQALGQELEAPLTIVAEQITSLAVGLEGDRFVIRP